MAHTEYAVWSDLVYLVASVILTVWVARTLHANGGVFLVDAFHGNERLAASVNHLLVFGFYLINHLYLLSRVRRRGAPPSPIASHGTVREAK